MRIFGMPIKKFHPIVFIDYIPRTGGWFLVFCMLVAMFYHEDVNNWLWFFAIVHCLLWPQIVVIIDRFCKDQRTAEYRFLLFDTFAGGVWVTIVHFQPWFFITVLTSSIIGCIGVQGIKLAAKGMITFILGIILAGAVFGYHIQSTSNSAMIITAMISILIYSATMSYIAFVRSQNFKVAQSKLNETTKNLATLNQGIQLVSTSLDIDEVIKKLHPILRGIFAYDTIAIELADVSTGQMKLIAIFGEDLSVLQIKKIKSFTANIKNHDSLSTKVFRTQKTIYYENVDPSVVMYPMDREIFDIKPFLSWLCLPLMGSTHSIGAISFFSHYDHFKLDQNKIEHIQQFLLQLSVAINNATLYRKTIDAQQMLNTKNNELNNLSKQIARYLPIQLHKIIFSGKKTIKIESQRKYLTIFFSDIVNFTSLTEGIESEVLTQILNSYFNDMSDIALEFGGTIDKYIGDAIMIFFGDPESNGDKQDAIQCVEMAIKMQEHIKKMTEKWIEEGITERITVRMAITSGYCTVGNFGSDNRIDYTIIGDQVSMISKLQNFAQPNEILITEYTYPFVKDKIDCDTGEYVALAGFEKAVKTYVAKGKVS